ncbi:hypothetical protein HanIR_Chr12g0601001 [Helianthus annuus]|nr:hypothetical protein HanIR_Chr12g0601001 [Helianthus annuus]
MFRCLIDLDYWYLGGGDCIWGWCTQNDREKEQCRGRGGGYMGERWASILF